MAGQKKRKPIVKKGLNERQRMFCQYFVFNDELRGNATQCYGEAYDYKLDTLSRDDAVWEGKGPDRKLVESSTYDKACNTCASEGRRLLRNPKIQDELVKLRNELLRDDIVDSELAKVIVQEESMHAKMMGISEYNKLKARITDKVDVTSGGEPISEINYVMPK